MSQVCIAVLLAAALAAPAAEPVVAEPVVAPAAEAATAPVVAPVAAPASEPVVAPVTAPASEPVVAPVTAPAPAPQPAPVVAPTVILAPAPAPAMAPAPATATPPPPRFDPELERAQRSADGLMIGGAVALGLGGASLVLVSWPAYALYRNSLERAESVRWVPEQDRFIDDARRRRSVMLISAGIGAGLTAVGTVLVATGLSRRARLRNATAATLSVAPALGGGSYGVAASMRF